jgi:hypothetical protein
MDALARSADTILRSQVAPALRLTELLERVRVDTGVRTLDADRLRAALELRPDRFRLLDPWRGPWRFVRSGPTRPHVGEPWVVVVGDPGDQGGAQDTRSNVERRLSASVRWLGASVDARSGRALTRWHRMVVAESAVRDVLAKKAS